MNPEIEKLNKRIDDLEAMFTLSGMSYEFKENIRNEVVKGEDSSVTLTQVYTDSHSDTVTAPKAYAGVITVKSKGKEYSVPYL